MIAGRNVVLGVTGGVAAYKSAYLARRLVERGAHVRVIMTASAQRFVGDATFAAITGSRPTTGLWDDEDVSPHTALARWADAIVVAPATASTIARIATGQSSDVLVATVIAATVPVVVAPAMHTEMWEHPATARNISVLEGFGHTIIGPAEGDLAGGDIGVGRLVEPDRIVDALARVLGPRDLAGRTVLVTAGGTREPIDPVRYIGNRSSGKMGNALALDAARRGATVTLVTSVDGPRHPAIAIVPVETAQEMADAVWSRLDGTDIVVMAAAVADFRPADPRTAKVRRADGLPDIALEPTPDILAGVIERGGVGTVVGFAAEAGSLADAKAKAEQKGVDLLVANDVAKAGSGFGSDTNEVTLIRPDGTTRDLPLMPKAEVASAVFDAILETES